MLTASIHELVNGIKVYACNAELNATSMVENINYFLYPIALGIVALMMQISQLLS